MEINLVAGIVWLVQSFIYGPTATITALAIDQWVPALGFSLGMDVITTGMIAGRLIYHHRLQRKMTCSQSVSYLPVLVIFIESAVLSTLSKAIQLILQYQSPVVGFNPIVIPLTVSLSPAALVCDPIHQYLDPRNELDRPA
jgi:hypothetical protein